MLQAKLKWVGANCSGELVHEGLVGEGVLHTPGRADPGRTEGRLCQTVAGRSDVGEGIGDGRILDDVAGGERRLVRQARQARRDERYVAGGAFGDEELRLPGDHVALRV